MRRFEGRVVLVTGSGSGIGRATAERLAAEGARLALSDVQAGSLETVAKTLREQGAEVTTRTGDVSLVEDAEALVRNALDAFGRLDVLCNVAGILRFGKSHEFPVAEWERVLAVNLTGTFLMCRAALPTLVESRGNIVNVASTSGLKGSPWSAAYNASKGGVIALTQGLAVEYGRQGVRVNAVCPASIETPINREFAFPEGVDRKLLERVMPFTGFVGPEQCASTIAFLASDDASHVNGARLVVDGGMST